MKRSEACCLSQRCCCLGFTIYRPEAWKVLTELPTPSPPLFQPFVYISLPSALPTLLIPQAHWFLSWICAVAVGLPCLLRYGSCHERLCINVVFHSCLSWSHVSEYPQHSLPSCPHTASLFYPLLLYNDFKKLFPSIYYHYFCFDAISLASK